MLDDHEYKKLRDWLRGRGYMVTDDETDSSLIVMLWQELAALGVASEEVEG